MLKTEWYVKTSDHIYRFKQDPKTIDNYSYKYKFWDTIEKKLEMGKSTHHILNFLEKVLVLKEKL